MKVLNFVDDLGILLICRPFFFLLNLDIINILDDVGISLIIRPLRYLYRFAEFIIQLTEGRPHNLLLRPPRRPNAGSRCKT